MSLSYLLPFSVIIIFCVLWYYNWDRIAAFYYARTWRELVGISVIGGLGLLVIASMFLPPQPAIYQNTFNKRPGDTASLKGNAYISLNEEAEKELSTYAAAKNIDAISRLVTSGRVALAPAGLRVTIIKTGWESSYIEVMDGPGRGARGWVINSVIK